MEIDSFIQLPSLIPSDTDGIKIFAHTIYAGVLQLPITTQDIKDKSVWIYGQMIVDKEGNILGSTANPINTHEINSIYIAKILTIIAKILNESLLVQGRQFNIERELMETLIDAS